MSADNSFHYEVETSEHDQDGNKVTTIKCHGRLVAGNAGELQELVKPLIPLGGRIVIDLGDLNYRVLELLRITNLINLFSS
jgi:hypothetical protein